MKQMQEVQNLEPTKKEGLPFFSEPLLWMRRFLPGYFFARALSKKKNLSQLPHSLWVPLKMDTYYYSTKDAHP